MGKNRKNRNNQPTKTNETGDMPDDLILKMKDWQYSPSVSPSEYLSQEEIQYIKEHMENASKDSDVPTGHLTRVEKAYHILDENGNIKYEVGDLLDLNSVFRSFSREPNATAEYLIDHTLADSSDVVVYRTSGGVEHYNITEHTNAWINEKESWVEPSKLRVDKITTFSSDNYDMEKVIQDELVTNDYNWHASFYDELPSSITFIDVSPQ